jgi:putative ABC transport system permease protein
MIRNYILVAVRNLVRHKFFSAINIFGLAISIAISMAVIMLVADQMMYDRFNTKKDRIYRVTSRGVTNTGEERGGSSVTSTSPMPLRDELLENYTGIEKVARLKRGFGNNWMEVEGQNINVPLAGYFADPEVLSLFEYELEYGDKNTALVNPYSVVITKKAAKKLFKEDNPVGLTIKVGKLGTYTVTGVVKETEQKSHIAFEGLASMATVKSLQQQAGMAADEMDDWTNCWNGWTYILAEPEKSREEIDSYLLEIYKKHIATIEDPETYKTKFGLQPLMDITPGNVINNAIGPTLPWVVVYFFAGLAGVIMLTSCFNFTNLSIARSLTRAREIGVRKATGAARSQIFTQFLIESVVVATCSLALAGLLMFVLKPFMLQLNFARIFRWDLEVNYVVFAIFLVFAIIVGVLAGFFPAVVLSGFQPVKVLKGLNDVKLLSKTALRKILLVGQFTLSLIFILTVIIMYNQLDLFLNKDYGFNMKENIMIQLNETSAPVLKTELLKNSNIKYVSGASHIPAAGTTLGNGFKKQLDEKEWTDLNTFSVDEDYLDNIEVDLVAGRFFSAEAGAGNDKSVVINERAVQAFHFSSPADAIGEELIRPYDSIGLTIVGVVKDYNHGQLMNKIEPLALLYQPDALTLLQVRYTGSFDEAKKSIEKAWATVNPTLKIDYKEVEAEIKFFYNTVFSDIVEVVGFIAALAIIISCMGLLGMATYTTETRMKEISIRKVLGCSARQLVMLLSKVFLKLLMISIMLGIPAAWFINNLWLEFMAYRTNVSFGMISLGVLILLLLGVFTIGSQTLRAAFANPVDNLKNE